MGRILAFLPAGPFHRATANNRLLLPSWYFQSASGADLPKLAAACSIGAADTGTGATTISVSTSGNCAVGNAIISASEIFAKAFSTFISLPPRGGRACPQHVEPRRPAKGQIDRPPD